MIKSLLQRLEKQMDYTLDYGRDIIRDFLIKLSPYKNLVDIGAGGGDDFNISKEICSTATFIGIDSNINCMNTLKAQGIKPFCFNIERTIFPFENESIDIFLANQVLEHTKEIFWVFHEVTRCLKTGGHFIIGVPNLASLHNRLLLLMGKQPPNFRNSQAHIRAFTFDDFMDFLNKTWPEGYCLKSFSGSQFYPFPGKIARKLSRYFPTMSFSMYFLLEKRLKYSSDFINYVITNKYDHQFYIGENLP
jgi:ubiquinone/menaquinone biosynthesis C-methylase UbiE